MADVLIEAVFDGHRTIVETHSEHLLLRILRCIRDTSRGASVPEEHRLRPADVAVYYFDPQPDGSTRAMRLRISPDGEFLDRWPRGFFTERDRDVFDE
jgi:predicted ATPase